MMYFNLGTDDIQQSTYRDYVKFSGLILAHKLGLPVAEEGWLVSNCQDIYNNLSFLGDAECRYLCRPDAPFGMGNHLPRGRDLRAEEIPKFVLDVKKIESEAIVLVFVHPSIKLMGHYIPRYKSSGGVMVVIEKGVSIDIEFVGSGFDVGDITRGKAVHTSLTIPWAEIYCKPSKIFRYNKCGIVGRRYDICEREYLETRYERLHELLIKLGEDSNDDVIGSIPSIYSQPRLVIFEQVLKMVQLLVSNDMREMNKIFGVMINLYGNKMYVFEIWNMRRSIK